jgi:hypothetical protein
MAVLTQYPGGFLAKVSSAIRLFAKTAGLKVTLARLRLREQFARNATLARQQPCLLQDAAPAKPRASD